eukprot:6179593-Pleurochrysis_carterae.AAC.1
MSDRLVAFAATWTPISRVFSMKAAMASFSNTSSYIPRLRASCRRKFASLTDKPCRFLANNFSKSNLASSTFINARIESWCEILFPRA